MFLACSEDQDGLVCVHGPFDNEHAANTHATKMVANVLANNPTWRLENDSPDASHPNNFSELTDLAEMDFYYPTDNGDRQPCHRVFVLRLRPPADDDE